MSYDNQILTEAFHQGRCVRTYPFGIRVVIKDDGEAWSKHIIIPRDYLVETIQRLRKYGAQYHDMDWWAIMPELLVPHSYHDGPGRGFAHGASVRDNRRYRVISQQGGLDV